MNKQNELEIANKIYKILDAYRKNPYHEVFESSAVINILKYFIENRLPIIMVIPAFHGKVENPDYVLGPSIDMGEYISLKHMVSMCNEIKEIYEYGLEFNMVHEGHFILGQTPLVNSAENLDIYLADFRNLLKKYDFIKSYSIYELLPEDSLESALKRFRSEYIPNEEELKTLLEKPAYMNLYQAYKKIHLNFCQCNVDFCALGSAEQKKRTKESAKHQIQAYFGFGKVVKEFFKDKTYLRLSTLYKDPSFVENIAINYLPHLHHFSTPTFNCLVKFKDGNYDFIKKYVAEQRNYQLAERNGLKYFKETI